jgi:hypothetical protein
VIALGNRETAAMVDENTKRAQNHLESLHSIGSAEQEAQAAIAELNGNTIAAILIQEQQRETETIAHLRAIGASDEELARMRVAMQAQANVQIAKENRNMVNTLGSDLEGIFNDIFSGNIAKRLLDIAKKFFFQLLAQFLLSFGQVRQMFAGGQQNGGGIFGGLLSMIFGNGGGGIFGGAGGGTTAALGGAGGLFNVGLGAPGSWARAAGSSTAEASAARCSRAAAGSVPACRAASRRWAARTSRCSAVSSAAIRPRPRASSAAA